MFDAYIFIDESFVKCSKYNLVFLVVFITHTILLLIYSNKYLYVEMFNQSVYHAILSNHMCISFSRNISLMVNYLITTELISC